jgi:cell division protein FtsQ
MPVSRPTPVFLPIDPRIRRRRIEVQRRAGRRRLRVLLSIVGIVLLSAVGWAATRSPLLDVGRVDVQGASHTPLEAVLDAARVRPGKAMVDVDTAGAAGRIQALPWVSEARVRRAWPATVLISVTERVATAVTSGDGQRWALLDREGRVLEVVGARPPDLVAVEGVGAAGDPGSTLVSAAGVLRVVEALSPALAARTNAVVVLQGGEIAQKLHPRGTVRFGVPEDVAAKVRATEAVLAQVDTGNLDVLDVRLPSSPVLTRA